MFKHCISILLTVLVFYTVLSPVSAQVPVNWTDDTGILTSQESVIVYDGTYSCQVDVNTGDQAQCDLTNTVSITVTAGATFKVSFWYWTSPNVRIRAGFDWNNGVTATYSVNYAGPTSTGNWEQFTYEGTAPGGVSTVNLRFRFYDITPGFVAPETQYIDKVTFESPVGTNLPVTNGSFEQWPSLLPEPTNYPTAFAATASNLTVNLTWTDATGAQLPGAYLIKASLDPDIDPPVDGNFENDDLDFSDGNGAANVAYGIQTYTFGNLTAQTTYYFEIYSYTNSGASVNYKTSGTPPSANATTGSITIINTEGFDNGLGAWSQISILGDQVWHQATYQGKTYANMNGYSGGPIPNEDWLISPSLNFDPYVNETLSFETAMSFTGEILHVMISEDYISGDPNLATWDELSANLSTGGYVWTPSGTIDVSEFNGNVHIAFKYLSDATGAAAWEVDGIVVAGEISGTNPVIIVTSPAAGVQWWQGNAYNITWNAQNTNPNVKIEVSANASSGTPTWTQIGTAPAAAGTWTWNIPSNQQIGNDYKIRISDYTAEVSGLSGLFSIVAPPTIYNIVINEIMYNPPTSQGPDTYYEWLEIYNNETIPVDISGWKITTAIDFTFAAGTILQPDNYLVVAIAPDTIINFYGITNVVGPFTGGINNTGELIELKDATLNLIDAVNYSASAPWPVEPNGLGKSLSLINPDLDNSLPESWLASIEDFGTPGILNFPTEPSITVTYPNGGEYFQQGLSYDITWLAMNYSDNVKIELTTVGGGSQVLAASIAGNLQTWTWNVPTGQPTGNQFKIKISDVATGTPADESDAVFSIIPPVEVPDLVISEIMYNPPETGIDSLEFIEIYNNDNVVVDISDYYFSAGVTYTFPSGLSLNPGQYQVVAVSSAAMFNTFGVSTLQWTSGGLSNQGETIELKDKFDNTVDLVQYGIVAPWDSIANGDGPSLELCDPASNNTLPENWTHSVTFAAINAAGDTIWATPFAGCAPVPPVADFVASNTAIQVGTSINFTDLSSGAPTSWLWTFEGGSPAASTLQTPPAITYLNAGTFDVTLTVANQNGSDTEIKTDYITVTVNPPPPVANFIGNPLTIYVGGDVDFTDLSTNGPTSWQWTFEGGTPANSSAQNPSNIVYNTAGTFDVTLVATNTYGSDTEIKTDYITVLVVPPPQAAFTANQTNIIVGQSVTFTDQSSGNPTSWQWTFEGGTPATSNQQSPPPIVYNTAGSFDVSLTVSNTNGSTTETKINYINVTSTAPLDLVIMEIMYNPPDTGDDTLEYIEIYNDGIAEAQLGGLYFAQGVEYTFPNYLLPVDSYFVVSKDSVAHFTAFGVEAHQWTSGALSNSGETIEIKDIAGNTIDIVAYDDAAPWPLEPDGTGPSLTICDPNVDNNIGSNWFSSIHFAGYNYAGAALYGTPGEICEFVGINEPSPKDETWIYPNPNNGSFTIKLPDDEKWIAEIYNLTGRRVYALALEQGVASVITCDLPKGLYMIKLIQSETNRLMTSKLIIQ